jgi:hypothetical protein
MTGEETQVGADAGKEIPEKGGSSEPVVKADESGGEIVKRSIKQWVGRMASTGTRFEVVKFDGCGNFPLWQTRVQDLLAEQWVLKGLQENKPDKMEDEDWEESRDVGFTQTSLPNIESLVRCVRSLVSISSR